MKHIAFIPDGNRRWAKNQGLPAFEGHRLGYERFKKVAQWCLDAGITEVTFWGFSTENWKRKEEEVHYLMKLLVKALTDDLAAFAGKDFRLFVIGRREDLSQDVLQAINHAEKTTAGNTKGRLNLCLNYGGRPDILQMVKQAAGMTSQEVTEDWVSAHLWTAGMSSPDLIVRTSGEQRLSGFLPWLGAYSEFYFADGHWPEFSEEALKAAMASFAGRQRRFGGDAPQPSV